MTLLVLLLFVANTINIGADLAAMGDAAKLVVGGSARLYTLSSPSSPCWQRVHSLSPLCRAAEVVHLLAAGLCRRGLHGEDRLAGGGAGAFVPRLELSGEALTLVVAMFGTTISPYLFFWQSSQEVEDEEADPERRR